MMNTKPFASFDKLAFKGDIKMQCNQTATEMIQLPSLNFR